MFHVGQMVVCVDDSDVWIRKDGRRVDQDLLAKGNIYTVRAVGYCTFNTGPSLGLWLEEIVRPGWDEPEAPFGARRFRPVKQTSIECFTAILNQTPQRESV